VNAIDDLEMLRAIPADHPQFKKVLWRRARLGDLSTATLIKPLIDIDNNWFRVLHEVWTEQFTDSLDKALLILGNRTATDYTGGTTNDHFMLAHLLRDIPQDQSQTLLMKHWDHLKFSPLFVQAALYIGSPECAELASKIISSYPNSTDPFQHVGHFFGFFVAGLMDRLKQQHLEVLLPYLSKLDHHSLTRMIDFCEHRNLHAWSLYHLKPELDQRRAQSPPESAKEKREFEFIVNIAKRHFPSDIDLIEKLDWIEQQERYSGHIYHWSEEFERRQDDHVRWQRILVDWFSQKPTIDRFRIFAEAILRHGTRNDIDMLYKLDISDHTDEVEKLRANAKFSIKSRSLR
jgi:hypothetical protein